ncbi:hypothetical protein [Paraburkholderia sp. BCC1885]|uniref:hypothetical protein n=1 Tax=Paraburkholderia sp. BCC1885 TaxID=2562669 RepID=UPI0011831D08|nr:hypothetical protein [Paraburkholderia sp. BCC1885]
MSDHLKAFLSEYLEWVDCGALNEEPFDRYVGLCTNFVFWDGYPGVEALKELKKAFADDGLDKAYPFGGCHMYDNEQDGGVLHLNIARIAWVRSKVAQFEVV